MFARVRLKRGFWIDHIVDRRGWFLGGPSWSVYLTYCENGSFRTIYIRALNSDKRAARKSSERCANSGRGNRAACHCLPGHRGNPAATAWKAFNRKASGRVYVVAPIVAGFCHTHARRPLHEKLSTSRPKKYRTGNRLEFLSSCVSNSAASFGDFWKALDDFARSSQGI